MLQLAGYGGALVEAEHAEGAGEFVGDIEGGEPKVFGHWVGCGGLGGTIEGRQAIFDYGSVPPPEIG
jgi:hypothetical protein